MNLGNKLKDLPHIMMLTLDEREDRQQYAEIQYDYWGIKNYTKVSGSKYQFSTYEDWKHMVKLNPFSGALEKKKRHITDTSIALSYLLIIKNWLETTNEKYLILMEDDYDLFFIEYWHFDWNYLMNNIPYDWDCIQMSFENPNLIPCFLHPILPAHGVGGCMINRRYAEKIISLHYKDDKFDLSQKICNYNWSEIESTNPNFTVDYFLCHNGKTYSIPLFSINQRFGSYAENICRKEERSDLEFSYKACKKWWTELRDQYTLDDFFTYGKPNDRIITPEEFQNV
jgi:hypothetical protein